MTDVPKLRMVYMDANNVHGITSVTYSAMISVVKKLNIPIHPFTVWPRNSHRVCN